MRIDKQSFVYRRVRMLLSTRMYNFVKYFQPFIKNSFADSLQHIYPRTVWLFVRAERVSPILQGAFDNTNQPQQYKHLMLAQGQGPPPWK